jgi:hypothetical protein
MVQFENYIQNKIISKIKDNIYPYVSKEKPTSVASWQLEMG